ncbi:MAG: ACP S-malonyltransferase [Gammaproteobacteria bacterium]
MDIDNETTALKRLAFVFPGQGSQSVGMLAELAQAYPGVKETFREASAALGYDLWELVQQGPEADLNRTDRTQPAMLAAGVAVWRVWNSNGGATPEILAGHSLGEYTALVCAEALDFADAVRLVADRGRFMQEAVPQGQGAMAAILGLEDAQVAAVCKQAEQGEVVTAVNFNAPGQVVIAGTAAAVERAVALAREAGAKRAITLPVSVPSHCALMKPAAEQMRLALARVPLRKPVLPVLHNADVATHADADRIRDALVRQLYSPVRWVETVREMESRGVNSVIECGPGKVLVGLNKRIGRELVTLSVYDPDSLEEALSVV